ncbi:glycosyltransferase family 4 protein [Pantoea ananatis]|uniref:glycosyltransferase family 4 protein n=1 Tax=Pantoea ananas TaxID=553 RepID=UPI0021E74FF6|nr:glycosyltransferase family 4 protein [Pantoea ananatis]MCW0306901.1 N,N'-diacetylbacillosaminyl-diphospho-undecaprenol alpha-1,3-N-acetylgalactosaminyltransferase [Pantoea ananatis]MCW0338683.1 N,N'-diacetylbacillosaminyl-diphospho-undecaprenol alpha-1,3-N-acetylgalactosaminyltransferase [Pantoea ananatis]MCW0355956.1 N,N'-diacetylbacillosaminyl-diphospho-undecaprenol alpha-1,3-N-acetylgalactosaminyltransferase [Pantoea ananatis]MCW0360902.1 N,N'-diacetylbacillosaminyl-diphospho-undecaprenol
MSKIFYVVNTDWYFDLHWLDRAVAAKNKGYQITIITEFLNKDIELKFRSMGFECISFSIKSQSMNPFLLLKNAWKLRRLIQKNNTAIIHCITIKAVLIGGIATFMSNVIPIYSIVGLGRIFYFEKGFKLLVRNLVLGVMRFIFKNKKAFLLFEHEKDRFAIVKETGVVFNKTLIISGAGVDITKYEYVQEKNRARKKVLFASRLLLSKGLGDLIDIKIQLEKESIYFDLLVAGIIVANDSDSIPIETIYAWSEAGHIIWLGERDDINKIISDCNIVVLPSIYPEGIPRILLEAGACGRSSLCYDSGGCSALIKNNINGFIVEKNDLYSLKEHLKVLILDDELRNNMGINAHSIIVNSFSSNQVISQTLSVYESVLSER